MAKQQFYVSFIVDKTDKDSEHLHFTCPFVGEADQEKLDSIKLFLQSITLPIELSVEEEIMVGEQSDIPAVLVKGKDDTLWRKLIDFQKKYVMPGHISAENWAPHITLKGAYIQPGSVVNVINVMIKSLNPKKVIFDLQFP
jgi:2'-5' RNA ligase